MEVVPLNRKCVFMITLFLIFVVSASKVVAWGSVFTNIEDLQYDIREAGAEQNKTQYPWPMFRHDLRHTGHTESPAPETNQTVWRYETGGDVSSSPAVVNGKVYVGSKDGYVYCLNASDGSLIWRYETESRVESSPAVADGRVYVGSEDDYLYCLDASTGDLIWRYLTGGDVDSSPAVTDGRVYVGSKDKYIHCLDASTGDLIWKYETEDGVWSSPCVMEGRVYVASLDLSLYCLDAAGSLVWKGELGWMYVEVGAWLWSSPAIAHGRVYAGSWTDYVYCLNASDGSLIWRYKTEQRVESSPAVAYDRVYVASEDNYTYCLDAFDGSPVWKYRTGDSLDSSPAVADGRVYVGSEDDYLYCLDASTGDLIWRYLTGGDVDSSPAVADGRVYVGSDDGHVYCFGPKSPSSVGCSVSVGTIRLGESITVFGSIEPPRAGANVTLTYTRPDESTVTKPATTNATGSYSATYEPDQVGVWSVYASWLGDVEYEGAKSQKASFAVKEAPKPAEFMLGNLEVSPSEVEAGKGVRVTLDVSNIGEESGTKTVTLKVNGVVESTRDVTLSGGETHSASFTVTREEAGTYRVEVDGLEGEFKVTAPPSRCIIATATYGSELSPEVRFLRSFREQAVLSTFAGSQFMSVFNAWYYSFSPGVANFIAEHPIAKSVMKAVLYPLIGILHLSVAIHTGSSFSNEVGVVMAGLVASGLIGIVYFSPPLAILLLTFKRLGKAFKANIVKALSVPWFISLVLIIAGEVSLSPMIMMIATGAFVLLTLSLSAVITAMGIAKVCSKWEKPSC